MVTKSCDNTDIYRLRSDMWVFMNTAIHCRLIPAAIDLGHDPKYGGWIDPFKGRWGQGKEKKKKTYEYY